MWSLCLILLKYVEDKLSRKILEQARKQQNELEAEFGAGSSSRTSLKEPQTKLDVGELIGGTLESDDDNDDECDVASTTNEQFYENFVSDYLNSVCQEKSYWGVVTTYSTCVINFSGTHFGYLPRKSCSGAELCAACMLSLYILDEYMKSMWNFLFPRHRAVIC